MGQLTSQSPEVKLSSGARAAIVEMRAAFDRAFAGDPAVAVAIGWGYLEGADPATGQVMVSFYPRSMTDQISGYIDRISDLDCVLLAPSFFVGRVIDHSGPRGFFLRSLEAPPAHEA